MRTTAPDRAAGRRTPRAVFLAWFAAAAVSAAGCFSALAAEKTPFNSITAIASALSENDPDGALEYFDSKMPSYADIEQKVEALTAQDDISCAIDVVTDTPVNGAHKLDLDWFMQLKSQGDSEQIERRRQRVEVEMRQIKGAWKITAISPIGIFDPIAIQ
jgi:hypothetical protein